MSDDDPWELVLLLLAYARTFPAVLALLTPPEESDAIDEALEAAREFASDDESSDIGRILEVPEPEPSSPGTSRGSATPPPPPRNPPAPSGDEPKVTLKQVLMLSEISQFIWEQENLIRLFTGRLFKGVNPTQSVLDRFFDRFFGH
jgi:hypothetical protein